MAKWASTVDAYEEYNSRRSNWDPINPSCSVQVRVKSEDASIFCREVFGSFYPFDIPFSYNFPLIAWKFEVTQALQKYGTGVDEEQMDFDGYDALITIHYQFEPEGARVGTSGVSTDPNTSQQITVTESFDFDVEYVPFNAKNLRWDGGANANPPIEPREIPLPKYSIGSYTRTYDGYIKPYADWIDLINTLNNAEFTSNLLVRKTNNQAITFGVGQLKLRSGSMGRSYSASTDNREQKFDLKLIWDYREGDFNQMWRTSTGQFEDVLYAIDGSQYLIFSYQDHSPWLF